MCERERQGAREGWGERGRGGGDHVPERDREGGRCARETGFWGRSSCEGGRGMRDAPRSGIYGDTRVLAPLHLRQLVASCDHVHAVCVCVWHTPVPHDTSCPCVVLGWLLCVATATAAFCSAWRPVTPTATQQACARQPCTQQLAGTPTLWPCWMPLSTGAAAAGTQ